MRSHAMDALETRAAEALREVLEQVSTIKVRDLRRASKGSGQDIVAHIDVLGHGHTLACKVESCDDLSGVERALSKLAVDAARLGADKTLVLIVPSLSAEAQALCKERHACFLDLEGNARLMIDEVFIVKRSLCTRSLQQSSSALTERRFSGAAAGFPPARAESPSGGSRVRACGD